MMTDELTLRRRELAEAKELFMEYMDVPEEEQDPLRRRELADAVLTATRIERRVWLSEFGVECEECEGYGEVVAGWGPASTYTPSEPSYAKCETCKGWGRRPKTDDEWIKESLSRGHE